MQRLLIIANPLASGFTGASLRSVVAELKDGYEVETAWPQGATASREAAAAAAAEGFDVVAAMGGDGVAHHVANGLINTGTALAVIPAGTTNVVARIAGFPTKAGKAAAALLEAEPRSLTLAHVTDGARADYALFSLGIGFDADVVRRSERRPLAKGTIGALHYVRSALSVALRDYPAKPANLRATCDGESIDAVSVMVQVHYPYTYFGRVPLSLTDETADGPAAFAARRLPVRRSIAILARSVARRRVSAARGVKIWPGFQKLIVEADPAAAMQADGDFLGDGDYFEITPAPDAITMLLPRTGRRRVR